MLKRGKKKDEEEYAFDDDAPPKKISKKDSTDDDSDDGNDIVVCEISKNRRVSVRNWQGKFVVDIREFYVKDGKQMPGKKVSFWFCMEFEIARKGKEIEKETPNDMKP
ncbi:hypothetical protein ACSBR1_009471 [Camellia fascicularis]